MEITEVRIKLMEESEDRLRAFCSITFDHCFVVRDLKIIDGVHGPFVAMPSRKLTGHCQRCGHKNHLRALYCNQCGVKVRSQHDGNSDSPQKLYADVAHPINSACRELIQNAVIEELRAELSRAGEPGYRSRYDDEFMDAGPESEGDESSEQVGLVPESNPEISIAPPTAASDSTTTKQSPPSPHFNRPRSSGEEKTNTHPNDDSFGAGIF